ncbi:ABC transporter substrate-binding protein [Comamonas endophytica]|uniref:ABC transporter substrate-binding protein n=1 Tax=Comamonas endophytica TaxID=2949090 RepID=A0ABY6GF04_9BURK|nr:MULTISPECIES: ABC transporter substrate-binding protein [unclassified Acidovorax]MCD2512579.1 ABC transporter substrate-binding protein [Acidovorax sp. D4N7]UYG53059.1 ABC transporter substrate-binding protein [Acidovorax sp. 5MLIR]
MNRVNRRLVIAAACAITVLQAAPALAQEVLKVGLVAEMSGPFADFGRQMEAGIKLYQKQHGDTVAGRKVVVVTKDVAGPNPELAKRLATELIVREKVQLLAGFGFTPNALSVAPLATQAKVPMLVMNAASSGLTAKSPYMLRTSFGYDQIVPPIAQWARKEGVKKAYVLVADYAPGHDAEAAFIQSFKAAGGEIVGTVRTPVMTVDFAPYIQRIKDAQPDALFTFVNAGDVAPALMKEFREKGLHDAGIRLIGTGDIVFESAFDAIGDKGQGVVTSYPYSMRHASPLNQQFVAGFQQIAPGHSSRPTIMAVSAYDGMAALYAALKKTGGKSDGPALMQAFKDLAWESPRGPVRLDAQTRDIVQTHYIRRYEKVGAEFGNTEIGKVGP